MPTTDPYELPPAEEWLENTDDLPAENTLFAGVATENAARTIREVLEEAPLDVQVSASLTGPQTTLFELNLGHGVTLEALGALKQRFAERLSRFGAIRMLLPIPGRDRAGIEVPNPDRHLYQPKELFANEEWTTFADTAELPLMIGRDATRMHALDLATGNHLLVAGYDGAGKSNLLRQLLASLLTTCTPDQLTILLFNGSKGDAFRPFANIPFLPAPPAKDPETGTAMLEWCLAEAKRRRKLLAQAGARNLAEYRAAATEKDVPADVVLFLDEVAPLLAPRFKEHFYELLHGLDSAGAVGVHVVATTATVPDDELLGSFDLRICGQCPQASLSMAILGEDGAVSLLGQGDFLAKYGDSLCRCQSAMMSAECCQRLAECCTARRQAKYHPDVQAFLQDSCAAQRAATESARETTETPQLHFTEPTANDALRALLSANRATPEVVAKALGVSAERAGNLLDELTFHEYLGAPDENGERPIFREKIPGEFLGNAVETRKTIETLLEELSKKIAEGDPKSRTVAEYNKGVHAIGKKIVEEAAEVWMAAEYEGPENTSLEISQLLYHLLVLMIRKQITLEDIYKQL